MLGIFVIRSTSFANGCFVLLLLLFLFLLFYIIVCQESLDIEYYAYTYVQQHNTLIKFLLFLLSMFVYWNIIFFVLLPVVVIAVVVLLLRARIKKILYLNCFSLVYISYRRRECICVSAFLSIAFAFIFFSVVSTPTTWFSLNRCLLTVSVSVVLCYNDDIFSVMVVCDGDFSSLFSQLCLFFFFTFLRFLLMFVISLKLFVSYCFLE